MPPLSLNIADYLQNSQTNGPGSRDVFWVQGCTIGCPGCFNTELWSLEARHVIPVASLIDKLVARSSLIEGISVVGGEPMHQARALGALLEGIRQAGLSTVVYSGFTLDYLLKQDNVHIEKVLANTDILVDGPYVDGLQDLSLVWRGSTNQKIRFLTDRYTSKDVPPQDEYTNIEVHTYQQDGQETAIVRKTGITF